MRVLRERRRPRGKRGTVGSPVGRWGRSLRRLPWSWGATFLLVALTGAGEAAAQAGAGRLIGRVVSGQTGEPLAAVQVSIPSISRGTLSDANGRYVLTGVPAGSYELVAQSLGYGRKTVTGVEVPADRAATLDVALDAEAVAIEGLTVSAVREQGSATALLSERRRAAVVSDAIGSEQISRTPDGNAAAALKRVPGVSVVDGKYVYVRGLGERYGNTTLNGAPMPSPLPDRKTVPLDVIPSELLESVVTSKSYLPSQPGDYAGGLVQINTRTVPGSRTLKISASTGYNTAASMRSGLGSGGGLGFLGLGGPEGLPSSIFAQDRVSLPADGPARQALANALASRFSPVSAEPPLNTSVGLSFGDHLSLFGRSAGVVGTVTVSESYSAPQDAVERFFVSAGDEPREDYDFDVLGGSREGSLGALLGLSYEVAPAQRISGNASYNRLTEDQGRKFQGLYTGGDYFETYSTRYLASSIANLQLRGDHVIQPLRRAVLNWRVAYGMAGREEPGTRTVAYRGTGPGEPMVFLPSQSSGIVLAQQLDEELASAAVDLKLPFTFRSLPSTLSLGVSGDRRDRAVDTRRLLLEPASGLGDLALLPPEELFVPSRVGSDPGQFLLDDRTFPADNYAADQAVDAAYAMLDLEILPRLRAVGGVRMERASQDVAVTGFRETEQNGIPATALDDTDLMPALNLTYALTDAMNLRAAVSRTVGRPQFRELSPFLYADYFGDVAVRGNPFLVRSRILNTDLRWEWLASNGLVASVSGFHKRFENPIEPIAILLGTNPGRTFANTESATVYGTELELRAPLAGLAPALAGFSVDANVTLAASEVSGDEVLVYDPQGTDPLVYPVSRADDRPLFGQSPYVVNLGLTYFRERSGTSATVLFNRFGRRVDTTGGVRLPDVYEEGRSQLDVTVGQPLPGGLELKLSASRLLGGEVEFTQTFPNGDVRATRYYDLGRTFSISVGWQP